MFGLGTIRAGEEAIRAGAGFLMLPHPLTTFEVQKYYENLSLMVFIQEKTYLKGSGICNKPWWV